MKPYQEYFVQEHKGKRYVKVFVHPRIRDSTEAFYKAGLKTHQIFGINVKEKFQEDNWFSKVYSQGSDLKNYDCYELKWCPQEYKCTIVLIGKNCSNHKVAMSDSHCLEQHLNTPKDQYLQMLKGINVQKQIR